MANGRLRVQRENGKGVAVEDHEGSAQDRGAERGFERPQERTQVRVVDEILRLVDAARRGELKVRARAELFRGEDRQLVEGVNEMLDAILVPIGEGNRILGQISNGKIDELIDRKSVG